MGFSREVQRFIALVMALALTGTAIAYYLEPNVGLAAWAAFGLLTLLSAISEMYPIRSAKDSMVYVLTPTFTFAAALLLPGWLLSLQAAVMLLPGTRKEKGRRGAWARYLFNASLYATAGQAVRAVILAGDASDLSTAVDLLWVMGALLLYILIHTFLIGTIAAIHRKTTIWKSRFITLDGLLAESLPAFLGLITATLWSHHPWVLVALAAPLVVAYRLIGQIQMVTLAQTDPKTGLYNFRYFQQHAKEELERCAELRRPISVVFCDMDYLRDVNNTHGHLAGDKVLAQLGALLLRELPRSAIVSRFGGEEFVVLLPGVDREEAYCMAEQLRMAVKANAFNIGTGVPLTVTISSGVAGAPDDGATLQLLLDRADKAVYRAKSLGRNRVCLYREVPPVDLAGADLQPEPGAQPETAPPPSQPPAAAESVPAPTTPPEPVRTEWDPLRLGALVAAVVISALSLDDVRWAEDWKLLLPGLLCGVLAEVLTPRFRLSEGGTLFLPLSLGVSLGTGSLLGPPGAVAAALGAGITHGLLKPPTSVLRGSYGVSLLVIGSYVGAAVLSLGGVPGAPRVTGLHLAVAVGAVLLGSLVVSLLLVAADLMPKRGAVYQAWRRSAGRLLAHCGFSGISVLFAVLAFREAGWLGAMLAGIPPLLAYAGVARFLAVYGVNVERASQAQGEAESLRRVQRRTTLELIQALAAISDARDFAISGHSERVARYAVALARDLQLSEEEVADIHLASLLHDVGKFGIPEQILHKPTPLTQSEWNLVRQHTLVGEQILGEVGALADVAHLVGQHHERYDGTGYPLGRRGTDILMGARVIAVADAVDTMLTGRPYAPAKPLAVVLEEIRACAGAQFDPVVVDGLLRLAERVGPEYFPSSSQPA